MADDPIELVIARIVAEDPRYPMAAYQFVREGLFHTLKQRGDGENAPPRHVSGQELLEGLRAYALEQFGPMTRRTLNHWGIRRCEDFGEIVFNMVRHHVLGKTAEDRMEDFQGGYDFDEAFVHPFRARRRPAKQRVATPPPEDA